MKKHAYLILAHNNFYCLEKLLRLLDDPRNDIFLHIDKKVKNFNFHFFYNVCKNSRLIYTPSRINVSWGTQSLVRAELVLYHTAYNHGPYHYYHLLSGSDLPLKSQDEIHNFFSEKTSAYFHCNSALSELDYLRVSRYHFLIGKDTVIVNYLRHWMNAIQTKLGINRLKNCPMKIIKGWEWGSIPQNGVDILIEHTRDILLFTRRTLCSDEIYKQTFLMHYNCKVDPNGIHHILWNQNDTNHPLTFEYKDFKDLLHTDYLFARKFDETIDKQVIDSLFNYILQRERQAIST